MLPCSYHSELVGLLALASLLAACEHQAPGRHYPNQTGGSSGVYDAGSGTCPATCSTPPGTIQLYEGNAASDAELWAGLVGVWQICSGAHIVFNHAPPDTIGVEFAPPTTDDVSDPVGNLFFLTRGPSGPVRGAGFEYQEGYEVFWGGLYCFPTMDSHYFLALKYSPCPREWQLDDLTHKGTLVPF